MRGRNSLVVVVALATLLASSASAIELSIRPNWESEGDKLDVSLSTTGVISLYMEMGAGDGNVSFFIAFLDATPINSGDAVGYDVVGNEFKMVRDDGSGWFRNEGDSSSRNIEDYSLIAADDEDGGGPGTNGPGGFHVDSIIIHGTEVGSYDLYYENRFTAEGAARSPGLFDAQYNQKGYAVNLRIPGFIWFVNAWRDVNVGDGGFDVPFVINVIPEPASMVLLAVGGLVVLRRR